MDSGQHPGESANLDYSIRTQQMTVPSHPMDGRSTFQDFASGISLAATDALEMADLQCSTTLYPGLSLVMMLEGSYDATIEGAPVKFSARRGPVGRLISVTRPTTLLRTSTRGRYVRKVTLRVPISWFEDRSGDDPASTLSRELEVFLRGQAAVRDWEPSTAAVRSAEDLLTRGAEGGVLTSIASERDMLTILADALSGFRVEEQRAVPRHLRARDMVRAQTARELILRSLDDGLHLPDIAAQTGMSVSTLQRVFRDCYGQTVMEFARVRRLEMARDLLDREGLSVGDVAQRVGYSSPANFATAFHREFGYPPSQVKERARRAAIAESERV
ncbi:AraC family transcriptional regulator [Thalassobaculum sp. OXR-137]|uniref:helix-turn-helix transcriptional regulator n=1 Tax=Thalassobaculum sp. OXR-137 TaxID=3100173 RepID=UPI002AC9708B|nr:AraC family transcriptional regulator [Thalassobaculum sp. OXR-137]WPZ33732.1 AraC family transcriptional regulator [Thalassobaculum sp. OXR-137]